MTNSQLTVPGCGSSILKQVRKAIVGKDNVLIWVLASFPGKTNLVI